MKKAFPVLVALALLLSLVRVAHADPPPGSIPPVLTGGSSAQTITGHALNIGTGATLQSSSGGQIIATSGAANDPRLSGTGVAATGAGGSIFYTNSVLPGAQVSGTVPSATVANTVAPGGTMGGTPLLTATPAVTVNGDNGRFALTSGTIGEIVKVVHQRHYIVLTITGTTGAGTNQLNIQPTDATDRFSDNFGVGVTGPVPPSTVISFFNTNNGGFGDSTSIPTCKHFKIFAADNRIACVWLNDVDAADRISVGVNNVPFTGPSSSTDLQTYTLPATYYRIVDTGNLGSEAGYVKLPSAPHWSAIFEGDSIMHGDGGSDLPFSHLLAGGKFFQGNATEYNVAVGGSTLFPGTGTSGTNNLTYRYSPVVAPLLVMNGGTTSALFVHVGINDLEAFTPAAYVAELESYLFAPKLAGVKLYVDTVCPSTRSAAGSSWVTEVNKLIARSPFPDIVFNTGARLPDPNDAALFVDGTHWTGLAHRMIAREWDSALLAGYDHRADDLLLPVVIPYMASLPSGRGDSTPLVSGTDPVSGIRSILATWSDGSRSVVARYGQRSYSETSGTATAGPFGAFGTASTGTTGASAFNIPVLNASAQIPSSELPPTGYTQTFGDANVTVSSSTTLLVHNGTITAPRTVTLPAVTSGTVQRIAFIDVSGSLTTTNNLTLAASGTNTFNGSAVIGYAYDSTSLTSDGTNTWTRGVAGIGNGGTGATTNAGARTNLGAAASGSNSDITSLNAATSITSTGALTVASAINSNLNLSTSGTGNVNVTGNITFPSANTYGVGTSANQAKYGYFNDIRLGVTGGGSIDSNSGGTITIGGNACVVSSNIIGMGGFSSSQTSIRPSGTTFKIRLGDNSADAPLTSGTFTTSGNLVCSTAGTGLQIKSGTNQRAGNATLVGGTVTVANTTVTANTIVMLTQKTAGGTLGAGGYTYSVSAGSSFTITSVDLTGVISTLDTSVVSYLLIELN